MSRPTDELIYDRTELDVLNKTDKGYHNYTDLNRVEKWSKYINDLLTEYHYSTSITIKDDWNMNSPRLLTELERIRQNIAKIRDNFFPKNDTPETPTTLNNINIEKANNIEKILYDIDILIVNMGNNFRYSGTFYSGEGGLI